MKKFENRIVVITRETRLEKVLEGQNTISQAKFYINRLGADFEEYESEHRQYNESVQNARRDLEEMGKLQILDRKYLPNFIFAPDDIIVVIGQDGLVANTIKYLDGQPVIGINPDTSRWDGVLLPFVPSDAAKIIEETIRGKRKMEEVTMAKIQIQNGQELLAVNDFFIGQKGHTSARYVIKYRGLKEPQSSSGVIISTGLGSTGWMKSIIAGASRISNSVIGKPYGGKQESEELAEEDEEIEAIPAWDFSVRAGAMLFGGPSHDETFQDEMDDMEETQMDMKIAEGALHAKAKPVKSFFMKKAHVDKKKTYGPSELSRVVGKWSSRELIFAVREPFPSKTTGTNLVFGTVSEKEPLKIESLMGENGVIFSDGIEGDFISFNSGAEAVIGLADKRGRIVI
jgi:NAD kinase